MPDLILFAQSLYEQGTVTVTSEASGFPKERLFNREKPARWKATSAAQQDLDLDSGAAIATSAIALVNHNLSGVTITVQRGATPGPSTVIATLAVDADPYYATWSTDTSRYTRVRIPAFASAPEIGELLLGVPNTITHSPLYRRVTDGVRGNVRRDESPGGTPWKAKLGAPRARLVYGWETLVDADKTAMRLAFAQIDESAKNLIVQDIAGVLRWMECLRAELDIDNVANGRHAAELELLEAL